MTGWAATNTLRDNTVTLHYYSAKERHVDGADCPACSVTDEALAALALVEAALDAAEKVAECEDYWDWVTSYAPALKAALRAVREGAS